MCRKLARQGDTSLTMDSGAEGHPQRKLSNIREMVGSQEEIKIFE